MDNADALLRTLGEFQEQLDEQDEDLPRPYRWTPGVTQKASNYSGAYSSILCSLSSFLKHTPFSKTDPLTLLRVKIKTGPLLLSQDVIPEIESYPWGPEGSDRTG